MAWFSGKVSLGNFPDLAGAVNKFSESVKNIEKNFDSALGLDDKAASGGGGTTSTSEGKHVFVYKIWNLSYVCGFSFQVYKHICSIYSNYQGLFVCVIALE